MQRYDLLPKQAIWHYLLARDNSVFPDHACSVKMAGCWPRSFFTCLWTTTPSQSKNRQETEHFFMNKTFKKSFNKTEHFFMNIFHVEEKEGGQYPAILTSRLANNSSL